MKKYPDYTDVYCNLGVVLKKQGRIDEAIQCYEKVLGSNPNHINTIYNLGGAYTSKREINNAIKWYEKALQVDPDYIDTYLNLGIAYLLNKDFEKGWKYYEYRFNGYKEPKPDIDNPKPKWDGSSLENKTIYILHEQGVGDTIQFVRFLSYLKKFNPSKVLFRCQESVENLLKINDINAEIVDCSTSDKTLEFDTYLPLLSLPYYLKPDLDNMPDKYLKADSSKVINYKQRFFDNNLYKIGIFWQGNPNHKGDKWRSFPLNLFCPLFEIPNTQFYSLQKGFGIEQLDNLPDRFNIINLEQTFMDFSDTAAAIENLDLVITIDSAVAHLAGAMGKKVWIIIESEPDWRWFFDEEQTVWYKSARIFRPGLEKDKSEVISRIYASLTKLNSTKY